jgi:hypothetical protein
LKPLWTAKSTPASRHHSVLTRIVEAPARAMAAILFLHAVVWTALPSLLYANLPLDLIEALTYGREWQLGYDKLPPLPWWLVEIAYRLFGHDFAYYLLAQIAVVAALWLIWLSARPLAGPLGALVAVLIVDGLHYLNYTSTKFNHDVVQLPFWALAGFAFHRALRGGRIGHWLLLGFAIGVSLWSKYFVVVLAAPLALFILYDREARKVLATPGPYIAVVAALITMAPHIVWLVQNDFLPFIYAEHRALPSRGLVDHIWHPLQFGVGQAFFLVPSLLIALPLFFPRRRANEMALSADTFAALSIGSPLAHSRRSWLCRRSAAVAQLRCGAIRSGSSSDYGLCCLRTACSTSPGSRGCSSSGRPYSRAWRLRSSPTTACCRTTIIATGQYFFRGAIWGANYRSATARRQADRSAM